ncbi:MAG: peptidylprolyl isomerase [Planctomycetota bacterium]
MQISRDAVVLIDYTLKGDDGTIFDSSEGRAPLAYLHGHGNLLSGVEQALLGKAAGDEVSVSLSAADGYGEHEEGLIARVPRAEFPEENVEVGMQFRIGPSAEESRIVTVTGVDDAEVILDANHPLAGERLNFEINVVEVRVATSEELSHGHVHGPGGHHH